MSIRPTRGIRAVPMRVKPARSSPDHPIDDHDDHDDNSSESDADAKHGSSRSKRFTVRKSAEQVKSLQRAYAVDAKPTKDARRRIADEIGLTERIVTTWFRDQRSSDKKKHTDSGIGPVRNVGDRRARTTRLQSPSGATDPESDMERPRPTFVTTSHPTPYAPPSIHIQQHQDPSYLVPSSSRIDVHPYSPDSKLGHLARLSDDLAKPLATPNDHWRASPSTWPPSPNTGKYRISHPEMRIMPTATPRTELDHLPIHSDDESDELDEDDDEIAFNHLYTPNTTYQPLPRHHAYTPSPVRSEITLPSLNSEFKRTFPAVPSPANIPPPANGGWTSAWRWGQYGHFSNIRSTLSCAEWTPEPGSDDGASERSMGSPIGNPTESLELPPLRMLGQPIARRTSSPMKLPVILNPEPTQSVHFQSRL